MEDEAAMDCWSCRARKVSGATIGRQSPNEITPSREESAHRLETGSGPSHPVSEMRER